jgi:hypothetical protein
MAARVYLTRTLPRTCEAELRGDLAEVPVSCGLMDKILRQTAALVRSWDDIYLTRKALIKRYTQPILTHFH